MQGKIKDILILLIVLIVVITWFAATLEHIAGKLSPRVILVFLFGIFIGIVLTLFEGRWKKR